MTVDVDTPAPAGASAGPEQASGPPTPRPIPTTRVRGRMSATKHRALETLGPRYGLDVAGPGPDDRSRPGALDRRAFATAVHGWVGGRRLLIDVGVGRGDATVAWARDRTADAVLAVELHRPGLALALIALDEAVAAGDVHPDAVRVVDADVRDVLAALSTGGCGRSALSPDAPPSGPCPDPHAVVEVAAVRVLFPDPWPKRRHRNRRLVDDRFVATVGDALAVGGTLHVATDHRPYAEQVVAAIETDGRFEVDSDAARPPRPVTVYEGMARDAGRPVTEVVATRRSPAHARTDPPTTTRDRARSGPATGPRTSSPT